MTNMEKSLSAGILKGEVMKKEKTTLRNVKKKLLAVEEQLHFLAKEYQKQLNEVSAGATIGPEGQAIAARLTSALAARDYCALSQQEIFLLEKA